MVSLLENDLQRIWNHGSQGESSQNGQHFRLVNYSNLPSRMVDFPHLSVCLQEGTQETQGNLVE